MFTLLVILVWIAVALIYAIQFQVVRDYKPVALYRKIQWPSGYSVTVYTCKVCK